MKRILSRIGVFASLVASAIVLSQTAAAQSNVISDYAGLATALNAGNTVITNFSTNGALIALTTLAAPTFQITTNVTINAGTNTVIFQGNNTTRFFFVHTNAKLTLNNVALVNGGSTNGGAIYNQGGTLVLSNCVLQGNMATNGNGLSGGSGPLGGQGNGTNGGPGGSAAGGAIYSTGPLFISYSILTNNTSQAGNGGNGGTGTGQIANGGGAGFGGNSFGGAIYSVGSTNVFFMTQFAGNSCIAGNGGTGGSFATNITPAGSGGAAGLGGSCAGGAMYIGGPLFMTNCLFFTNVAVGGSTGAAEVDSNGGGAEGSDGGSALGGGLFITNTTATAWIWNSVFFFNVCQGGSGGGTSLNAAVGGIGGEARGGGIWSSADFTQISFSTLATNFLFGGAGGTNSSGGISGTNGTRTGWDIFRSAGTTLLNASIISFDTNGIDFPNATGVSDGGYNVSSDASLTKNVIIPTTKLNTNPRLNNGLTATANLIGGNSGTTMLTLAILTNSPAQAFVPGVPGATFPATDETLTPRSTPTSVGAFEVNTIALTNTVLPTIVSTLPATNLTGAGGTVFFTNTINTNGFTGLPFGYQWQFNGSNIFDDGNYSGTQTNILKVRGISIFDQGQYTVIISPSLLVNAETSSVVDLILTNPPVIKTQPVSQIGRPSGAIVQFAVGVLSPLNYNYVWLFNGGTLPSGSEFSGVNSNVLTINPATAADAGLYSVIVSNNFGTKVSASVRLTIVPDHTRPTVVITSPANNVRTNTLTLEGSATDNAQVTNVYYWITNINGGLNPVTNVISGNATLTTNGVTNFNKPSTMLWSVTTTPLPGTNILAVQAVDYSSNVSTIVTRRFFYQVPSLFILTAYTNGGSGTLTGHSFFKGDATPTNNAMLNIGEGYSIVAAPNAASFLGAWTNYSGTNSPVVSSGNTLKFVMESNTVIQASFVSNIFAGIHGAYNGLFYALPQFLSNSIVTNPVVGTNGTTNFVVSTNAVYTNEVTVESAGMLAGLSLSKVGTYSGRILLAGNTYGFSGIFDAFGEATNVIKRSTTQGGSLTVTLNADTNGSGVITGTVTNASWPTNSSLWAHLSVTMPGSSNYTMILAPPTNPPAEFPPGYGYGLIADHDGTVSITGGLADGTTYSETVANSISNIVPVYISLYQKTGFLFGWLNLTNLDDTNADYELVWIKGTEPHPSVLFPAGFTNIVLAVGSPWTNPGAITLPSSSELSVSNSDLDLLFPVSVKNNDVLFNPGGSPTNSLTGTINLHTGQLQVTFGNGDGRATTHGFGAMLQNLDSGAGYFTTKTNAGSMILEPTNAPTNIPLNASPTSSSGVDSYYEGQTAEMIIQNYLTGGNGPPVPPAVANQYEISGDPNGPPEPPGR